MSNGIKFVFLLSVILIVMFSMTFAQDLPFNAEVIVDTARMRWGPGPAFTVQHYANLGHVLIVLEADDESDPPWTWYYARTPSGVQSWIRGDLIRRSTGAAARVDLPTGTFPIVENNLCNTTLFRRCQDGTDHELWEAGYWANDRYNHWETGGWNLNIVYHNNPCKSDRLCTTRQDWDAGRLEAELVAVSLTPDLTQTPVVIEEIVEVEVPTTWEILSGAAATNVLAGDDTVFAPPAQLTTDGGSLYGEFKYGRESVSVTCQYWYLGSGTTFIKSGVFSVHVSRLPTTDSGIVDGSEDDKSNVKCLSNHVEEGDVVARQWKFTISRSYSGRGQIRGVSWRMTASYGDDEPSTSTPTCARIDKCTADLDPGIRTFLANLRDRESGHNTPVDGFPSVFTASPDCDESRKNTTGEPPHEVTRYEHSCTVEDTAVESDLTFHFTHDQTRAFLKPEEE